MKDLWKVLWSNDSGQGMVEYALIIALVAIGANSTMQAHV